MINIFDDINLGGVSELLSGTLHARPSSDKPSIRAIGFSAGQTSPIVEVTTSSGSEVFKISNAMIDLYADTRVNSGNLILQSHSTRVVSGHYVAPLISNAVLSGSINANSIRITSLAQATAMSDAVTLNQLNTSISGTLLYSLSSHPAEEIDELSTTALQVGGVTVNISNGDRITVDAVVGITNDSGNDRTYTYTFEVGTFTIDVTHPTLITSDTSNLAISRVQGSVSVAGAAKIGGALMVDGIQPTVANATATAYDPAWSYNIDSSNQTGSKTVALKVTSDADDARQMLTLFHLTLMKIRTA